MRTKECTKCNTEKALTEFHRNKNFKDGRVYDCKPCKAGTSGMWENLDYSREDLYNHIESLFTPEMTWDNYCTAWELDHIIPMCSATNADEVNALNKLTNLQPLSPSDNSKKIASDIKQAK